MKLSVPELEQVLHDAAEWRKHKELWGASKMDGALYIRMTMNKDGEVFHNEEVISPEKLLDAKYAAELLGMTVKFNYVKLIRFIENFQEQRKG